MLRAIQAIRCFSSKEKLVSDLFLQSLEERELPTVHDQDQSFTPVKRNDILLKKKPKPSKKHLRSTFVVPANNAFQQFPGMHNALLQSLNKNYDKVLPIQENIIPLALKKRYSCNLIYLYLFCKVLTHIS